MDSCKTVRSLFMDAVYGTLTESQQAEFDRHLSACETCEQEYRTLLATSEIMKKREMPGADPAFLDNFWIRLAPKLDSSSSPKTPGWRILPSVLRPHIIVPVTAILCLIIGIRIGQRYRLPNHHPDRIVQTEPRSAELAGIQNRTQEILNRSQRVLLAFVNFNSASDDPDILNLPRQKILAENLVHDTGELKAVLSKNRNPQLESLITDLELILLQIANLESENSIETVEMIQDGLVRRDLLFKIQITALDGNQDETSPSHPPSKI